ncbi:MAG: STAS domain-containing protein [Xanthomonadales bacterium]|nr:STAS domain-containing protein [Xanthomonadales bacterium]
MAGLTVAVVALPLAMALAIASGTTPDKGLHTAIVAGFLISALGGSRVQIGGPTAAFIPVVFGVIERFGYGGLVLCTLLAGLILILAGLLRLGTLIKYMPQPVITGFTAGIAVSIFSSQVKDLLGLPIDKLPGEFLPRWQLYAEHVGATNLWALGLGLGTLLLVVGLRRWRPGLPTLLIGVVAASLVCTLGEAPVATIGSTFGNLPSALPQFAIPHIPFERTAELLPASLTIAFLAGVESLLSAVVADGMTGGRHRSNAELVAQGVANTASALIAGLPATGALARTATNVRAGARTPVAGMLHAVFLLGFMLLAAPLMRYVPLPALAGVLLFVAWNMSEVHRFRQLLRAPPGDSAVLLVTFLLTVVFDLTVAIEVGVVMAAFLFMHRMTGVVALESAHQIVDEDIDDLSRPASENQQARLPQGVAAFRIAGPLFFAVANRLDDVLNQYPDPPAVFILRMRNVPLIDASGVQAIEAFILRCQRRGTAVLLCGLQRQPRTILSQMGIDRQPGLLGIEADFDAALARAESAR